MVITYNNSSTLNVSLEGTLDTGLSIETESLNKIKLYPNPVKDSFSVNKNLTELIIYDISGKLIKAFKGNFVKGDLFDISKLSKSLYFTKIKDENDVITVSKLIKH